MAAEEVLVVKFKGDAAGVATAAEQAAAAVKRVGVASSGVSQGMRRDFTGVSRVLQDLPFGFIAIQNNITQLLPAAGGLGLALSAVVSALTFAQTGLSNWTRGLDSAKQASEKAKDALSEYVSNLDDISKIRVTGDQDAQKDIINLRLVYEASQNQALALTERKKAVDALQEQYPAYFKNLSDEAILAGGAQKAYEKLVSTLIATSRARAAQKDLDDLAGQQRVIDQQLEAAQNRANILYGKLIKPNENAVASGLQDRDLAFAKAIQPAVNAYKERNKLLQESNALSERQRQIVKEIQSLVASNGVEVITNVTRKDKGAGATGERSQFNFFDQMFEANPKTAKEKAEQAAQMYRVAMEYSLSRNVLYPELNSILSAPTAEGAVKLGRQIWAKIQEGTADSGRTIRIDPKAFAVDQNFVKLPKMKNPAIEYFADYDRLAEQYRKKFKRIGADMPSLLPGNFSDLKEYQKALDKIYGKMETMTELVSATLQPAFQNAFSEIFKGGNFMTGLLQGLGQAVESLITRLASAAALAAIISAITPGGSFKASFGLLSGLSGSGLFGLANGGLVTGATPALVGEGNLTSASNPEVIAPLNQLGRYLGNAGGGQVLVHEIAGDKLRLILSRTDAKQRRTN